jgi:myosin heavy subunit
LGLNTVDTVAQRPYTYVANVLVAVNPLRRVPDPPIESYRNTSIASNPPHPYGIAEVAFFHASLRA